MCGLNDHRLLEPATGDHTDPSTVPRRTAPHPPVPRARGGRRWMMMLQCLGLLCVALGTGCQDCDERFCRGVKLATVQMMAASSACCEGADDPACPDLEDRFDRLVVELHTAYDACHAGNFERMRQLLEAILRSLPRIFLLGFCGEDVDLGDWKDEFCHPYVNSSSPLLPGDQLAASIQLLEVSGDGDPRGPSVVDGRRSRGPDLVEFEVLPGSELHVDAWWGTDHLEVAGALALAVGGWKDLGDSRPVLQSLELRLSDGSGRIGGVISHEGPKSPSVVSLDPSGDGMLGAAVDIRLEDPWGVIPPRDLSWTAWIELPIRVSGSRIQLGDGQLGPAELVLPVAEGFLEAADRYDLLASSPGGGFLGDGIGPVPCQAEDGLSERERRWLERMRQCFPECFADH